MLAVLVVGAVLAGGAYYWRAQQATAATPQTLPVPVVKGDLNVNIESSGQVAPNRNFAVPLQTAGQVREVLVKAGDMVKQGQPLVRVDDSDLRLAVGQDEADLKTAQARRAALDDGPTAAELADAEATLAKARENLKAVQAGATAQEIAEAEADVRSTQLKLDSLQAGATRQEIAAAAADVKTAQLKLDKVLAGATAQEIAEAEADVRSAQLKLDQLKEGPGAAELAAAQAALTAAQEKQAALQAGPTEAERRSKELAVSQAENTLAETRDTASASRQKAEYALDKADHDLENAQDDYNQIAEQVLNADGTFKSDLPQSLINQYNGTLRAQQDAENNYRQAQQSLEDARKAEVRQVAEAQAKRDDAHKQLQELLAPPTAAELAEAQATVHNAQKTLDQLQAPPSAGDLQEAENAILKAQNNLADLKAGPSAADVEEAQAALLKAQNNLADLKAGPSAADVADAQAALLKAQNNLRDLRAGPSTADLASAQSQVVSAEAALAKLNAPPTVSDLASADAAVLQAEAALAQSRHELEQATLVAPFAGTVAAVDTEVGSLATAGEKVVTMNDESRLHLDIKLSESDVAKVKVDQPVNITFDALPGKTITGTVTSVATTASVDQNVVTYLVAVLLHPGALPVKVGMSGTAGIQVEQHTGVLQVPNRAIKTTGGVKSIQVLYGKDKTPVTVRVQTGATNGQMTEIVRCLDTNNQCLRQGDTVALELSGTGTARGPQGPGDVMTFGPGPGAGPPPGGGATIFIGP